VIRHRQYTAHVSCAQHICSHTHCFAYAAEYLERNKKLEDLDTVLDDKAIQELIGEDDQAAAKAKKAEETKKKKAKVQARLAEEKKAANKKANQKKGKKSAADNDDMDDADAMATFVKPKKN
jgi:septal ring factor EnvC (AmiA/AmiB activator)